MTPSRFRRPLLLAVLAGLLLGGLITALEPVERSPVAHVREAYHFTNIDKLTATSTLVVRGTVQDSRPGRYIGTREESRLRMREATVHIDAVLHGDRPGQELVVEELGWGRGGPVMLNGIPWLEAGDTALLFLTSVDVPGTYQFVGTQGHYLIESNGAVVWPSIDPERHHEESVVRRIDSRPYLEVARDIRAGSQRAKSGEVSPQQPH